MLDFVGTPLRIISHTPGKRGTRATAGGARAERSPPGTGGEAQEEGRLAYSYKPLLLVVLLAALIPTAFMLLSARLGPRRPSADKLGPYESGILPATLNDHRFQVKFYKCTDKIELTVDWSGPEFSRTAVPKEVLFHEAE